MKKYSVCAVICAGGKGTRAGFPKNKTLVSIGTECVLQKTLSAFDFPSVDEIVVAGSAAYYDEIVTVCKQFPRTKTVVGGETRFDSVYNALQAVTADIVLIHDGARPFVTREMIENCIRSVEAYGSGICAVPCLDTIAVSENGKIIDVPDRKALRQIQTPQGFFTATIRNAYTQAKTSGRADFTDDSSVFAAYFGAPTLCDGDPANKKLTYAEDFRSAFARCGFGVDTHAFGKPQDYIVLAGVRVPSESGLIAHSDGDVLAHAVMDAMLSAAGLRDIGYYFPDTDPKWRGADSMQMLEQVVELLREQGFAVKNLSVAVQAEKPRLSKYIEAMKQSLSGALSVDPTAVGISAGTNEGLGYIGEGKGITVNAYVLLREI
ncbi:MAG: 2-C-methyl-D-erythritol 4-phosphate cytidylyltransferase [Clostridia bacterium]|nr:2-C-methyl-D-erythritol 4-phosphate cytidylyltransferase [Clostridia bacterium]